MDIRVVWATAFVRITKRHILMHDPRSCKGLVCITLSVYAPHAIEGLESYFSYASH